MQTSHNTKYKKAVKEVKKLKNGKLAVRWDGSKKFVIVPDDEIAQYLVYLLVNGENVVRNINSRLR